MGCSIILPFTINIENLFNLGMKEAAAFGGQIAGNSEKGSFQIPALGSQFAGNYFVANGAIEISIIKKPFFIPCSMIESFLRQHVK